MWLGKRASAYTYTGINYLVFGGAVALLGMSAAALLPKLSNPDEAIPALIENIFPHRFRPLLEKSEPPAGFWSILFGALGGVLSQFVLYERVAYVGAVHPTFLGPLVSIAVLVGMSHEKIDSGNVEGRTGSR